MPSIPPRSNKFGNIPGVYEPPLSEPVIECAQRIATSFLDHNLQASKNRQDLNRRVRAAMGRRRVHPHAPASPDDQSITEGVLRALESRGLIRRKPFDDYVAEQAKKRP